MGDDGPRIVAGMSCKLVDGRREGWFVSSSKPGDPEQRGGYEYYRMGNASLAHHRILARAWGMIDSVYEDVEIDHVPPEGHSKCLRWLNIEGNLQPVDGQENTRLAVQRNRAAEAGQIQTDLGGEPI